MNLPNSLTVTRIFLVPLLVVVLLTKFEGRQILGVPNEIVGAAIFGLASLTDWADGYLARRRKQITPLGQMIDPLADKLLTLAALISLVQLDLAPAWVVALILGRDFAVTALHNNDRVGLVLFADGVREFLPPREGRYHLLRVIRELLFAEPRRSRTEIASAADLLANVTKKRNVVFVLSDFLDVDFEAPLRALGHRHDVIALILNDPREAVLPAVGLVSLEDAETGRVVHVDTGAADVREAYARAARERRAQRLRIFSRMHVDRVDLSTDRPYVPALLALFNARSRRN